MLSLNLSSECGGLKPGIFDIVSPDTATIPVSVEFPREGSKIHLRVILRGDSWFRGISVGFRAVVM
jgi:hypothetical protein